MTSEQPESVVEVIQQDRELAALLVIEEWKNDERAAAYRAGALDETPEVEIIARHRLATQPAEAQGAGEVERLRKLSDAARQGEWKVYECLPGAYEVCEAGNYASGGVCDPHRREDAEFIVAAVNFVRSALAAAPQAPADGMATFMGHRLSDLAGSNWHPGDDA